MKLISNRGNIFGKDISVENSPDYIDETLSLGYEVKVDLWYIDNEIFLGDYVPTYKVSFDWLISRYLKLWICCKNVDALEFLHSHDHFNYFWDTPDVITLTSLNYFWVKSTNISGKNVILSIPETDSVIDEITNKKFYGICANTIANLT